jgi:hypothetical protein
MSKISLYIRKEAIFYLLFFLLSNVLYSQTTQEKQNIKDHYDLKEMKKKASDLSAKYLKKKEKAIQKARKEGWIVRKELENGQLIEIQGLTDNGKPLYYITNNADAAATISTSEVWSGGAAGLDLSGDGMTVGEWDGGGVLTTHQEFTDQDSTRVTQKDSPSSTHYHATHVAGTMIAGGVEPDAKGMAYEGNLDAYDWNSDDSEMIDAGLNGLLISNHSYGFIAGWSQGTWYGDESISTEEDYRFGFYGEYSARWDSISYELPYYLIVKSAGNDRGDGASETGHPPDGGADGYDCIGYRGNAKNILTVGAAEDLTSGYTGNPSDVGMTSFSSWGPADDGRIKPDICGNGYYLYSTYDDNNSAYNSISGTSMSAPNVSGSLLLLQEHWNKTQGMYMKSSTLKGLVIHTADEAGANDGPDYKFGWGLMNTQKAAEVISNRNNSTMIIEDSLEDGYTYVLNVEATGTEPLVITVCWTDPAGTPEEPSLDPTTPMLVNDLDLLVLDAYSEYHPYKLDPQNPSAAATTGNNDVDNVEKIVIDNPTASTYNVSIDHEGTLSGGQQHFSMIISGIETGYPSVNTDTVYNITKTTAEVDAEVTDAGSASVTDRGVVYSTSPKPTMGDNVENSGSGTGVYTCSLTGLTPATTYYVRAFATNSEGTKYGEILEFKTEDYLPEVQYALISNISENSADVESEVTDNGGYPVTDRGFVYSTTPEPTLADQSLSAGSGTGVFNGTITSLLPGTKYYVRAYATNSQGTKYSEERFFTTSCGIMSDLPYQQEFSSIILPNCWENIDNAGTGDDWLFDNPSGITFNSTTSGNGFAILDSDYYGQYSNQDADLVTPTFDLSNYDSVQLRFEHYFKAYADETATLSYSLDGGSTWDTLQSWTATTSNPAIYEQDLSEQVGLESSVRFKWNYTGSWGWHWAVDDVEITGTEAIPTASITATPGCGTGTGSVTVYSDMSGTQTYYLCDGTGTTLDSWTGDAESHEFTGQSDGTYTGKVEKDGHLSELSGSVTLTNATTPVAASSAGATATTICEGESTELTYSGGSGATFVWYSESCGGTQVGTGNNLTVAPTADTTYYGRWENACGVTSCVSVTITVNPLPDPPSSIVALDTEICEGNSTRLYYIDGSGDVIKWYEGSCGGTEIGSGDEFLVTPSSTTTYYGRWENSCGESACESITITVVSDPLAPSSVNATATNICQGESTDLTYNGGSGDTFHWYTDGCGTTSVGTGNNLTVSPASTTTYYGRWENSCGESACETVTVTVNNEPVAASSAGATPSVICEGESTQLSYSGGSGDTFEWYSGSCGTTSVGSGNNLSVSPTTTTTYYGRWENDCGESSCVSTTVEVNQTTEITLQPTDVTACEGTNASFSVDASGTALAYSWQKDGVPVDGENSSTLQLNGLTDAEEGSYNCVVTGTCGEVTSSEAVLTVHDTTKITSQPEDKEVTENNNLTLSVSAEGYNLTYQWRKDGSPLSDDSHYSGATTSQLTINSATTDDAGSYDVVVSGDCGEVTSESAEVSIVTGLQDLSEGNIQLYPNPTKGSVTIHGKELAGQRIVIKNIVGVTVYSGKLEHDKEVINLDHLNKGIYLVKVNTEKGEYMQKIIIE